MKKPTDWIAVDWGTTRLRAWAMDHENQPVDQASSLKGMGKIDKSAFEPALLELIEPWLGEKPTNVIACGMVGAKQGWAEAPYCAVPAKPLGQQLAQAPAQDPRLRVHVISGLKQLHPADVMRGEETQIAGLLAQHPDFDGVLCLPGTHTKWARVSAGEVVSFATCMTGELFEVLSRHSVLRHSVDSETWDDAAFSQGVVEAIAKPQALALRLFSIRAESVLNGINPAGSRSRLSGILIGAELAAMRGYWLGTDIGIVGEQQLCQAYAHALQDQGAVARFFDAEAMTLAGLTAAYIQLKGTRS